jgi:hypothetical protein
LALTGCEGVIIVPPNGEDGEPDDTGTVNIQVSGDWEYDLKMDGDTYFTDVDEGTYTINDVPVGDHTFEAIDTDGESYGYASETQYISAGTNTVYLEPEPEPDDTGTVNIELSGDWEYDLKMDGDTYFTDVDEGTYTINDVPVGDHTFEAIDTDGASYGYASETQYISAGTNTVYLEPEPETGTVQIEVDDEWEYEVYMDGDYLGTTDDYGEGTFEDIPTGYHSFYVISTDGYYEGSESVTIDTGNNLVEIETSYTS